jgi:hypothetical protein
MSRWLGLREDQALARGLLSAVESWLPLPRQPHNVEPGPAQRQDPPPSPQTIGCVASIEGRWLTS